MSKIITLALVFWSGVVMLAQQPRQLAVLLSATVTQQPQPQITLHWNAEPGTTSLSVYRKSVSSSVWPEPPIAIPNADATSWTDTTVVPYQAYEYRVVREVNVGDPPKRFLAFGYIASGIDVLPALRGRVLLLVDSTVAMALASQIDQLRDVMEAEAWTVDLQVVPRTEGFDAAAVEHIRSVIREVGTSNRWDLEHILLLGKVAVPYSGAIAPDGHVPDHFGAWPADGIYGDVDGTYTDGSANTVNDQRPAQANTIGDGKYDQSQFASAIEVGVGRVDLSDLPEFQASEMELLGAYLTKNLAFRLGDISVRPGGIIDDNFGTYGEFFAATAWRSFAPFGGADSVRAADWFESLAGPTTSLWAYGCGAGSFTSCNGVGNTADFASKPTHAVFTQLFGSYFGDWNVRNNLLRAALAAGPTTLASSWAGRPAWYMHHMALGWPLGYSTRLSQNNRTIVAGALGTYTPNVIYNGTNAQLASIGDAGVHIALMGDPTLRASMSPVPAIAAARSTQENASTVRITWDAPTEPVDGYVVYRWRSALRGWEVVSQAPVRSTEVVDSVRLINEVQYRVHALHRRTSASGTYFDLGKGAETRLIPTSVTEQPLTATPTLAVHPNPASEYAIVRISASQPGSYHVRLVDAVGHVLWTASDVDVSRGTHAITIPVQAIPPGMYTVQVQLASKVWSQPFVVVR